MRFTVVWVEAVLGLVGCAAEPEVRWVRGYAEETPAKAEAGLRWQLSLLGGEDVQIDWNGDADQATVRFTGVNADHASAVTQELRAEAKSRGSIDLGRWLMRSLYDPDRHYAFVDAPLTFDDVPDPLLYVVTTSLLTTTPRRIHLPQNGELVMTAAEGEIVDDVFVPGELERIDILPNGQQRFTVYDADGQRITASSGPAGGPGRCAWCHENDIQYGLPEANPATAGGMDGEDFALEVERIEGWLAELRAPHTRIDWEDFEVHAYGELLVQPFLRPSAERLAREWGRDVAEVEALMRGAEVAVDAEYPEFGALYWRAEADAILGSAWAPEWEPVGVPESFR